MTKSWFIRADFTVHADTLDQAIEDWHKNFNWPNMPNVIFDGLQDVLENEWENSNE